MLQCMRLEPNGYYDCVWSSDMLILIHTLQLPILKIYLKSETLWAGAGGVEALPGLIDHFLIEARA